MTTRETFQQNLEWGQEAERKTQELLPGTIVPTGNATIAGTVGGGRLYRGDEAMVSPDLLQLGPNGHDCFFEVKRKTKPGYLRCHQEYTQGIDLSAMEGYERVRESTGKPVVIVIHEVNGPPGEPAAVLAILVERARYHGHEGSFGLHEPSWCWPRHVMWPLRFLECGGKRNW